MTKRQKIIDSGYAVTDFLEDLFDNAIIGVSPSQQLVCYDYYAMLDILIAQGSTRREAEIEAEGIETENMNKVTIVHLFTEVE